MSYHGTGSIYDPSKYPEGVPNPYTPRLHAWRGGPTPEEGTRYHGPVWTRPMWGGRWDPRPLDGLGATGSNSFVKPEFSATCPEGIPAVKDENGAYYCQLVPMIAPQFFCDGKPIAAKEAYWGNWLPTEPCKQDLGTRNTIIAAGIGLALVGCGVGAYFLFRK